MMKVRMRSHKGTARRVAKTLVKGWHSSSGSRAIPAQTKRTCRQMISLLKTRSHSRPMRMTAQMSQSRRLHRHRMMRMELLAPEWMTHAPPHVQMMTMTEQLQPCKILEAACSLHLHLQAAAASISRSSSANPPSIPEPSPSWSGTGICNRQHPQINRQGVKTTAPTGCQPAGQGASVGARAGAGGSTCQRHMAWLSCRARQECGGPGPGS